MVISEQDALYQLADLAMQRTLSRSEKEAATESLERMTVDARLRATKSTLHSLLRYQLLALLVRLHVIQARRGPAPTAAPSLLQRFKRYRLVVEQEFHHLHRVADYAKLIGCSQKSLQCATLDVVGVSAKTFPSQSIALEAKRLLVHTDLPTSVIGDKLGFDEVTNFVRFFRRQARSAPGEFRRRHSTF